MCCSVHNTHPHPTLLRHCFSLASSMPLSCYSFYDRPGQIYKRAAWKYSSARIIQGTRWCLKTAKGRSQLTTTWLQKWSSLPLRRHSMDLITQHSHEPKTGTASCFVPCFVSIFSCLVFLYLSELLSLTHNLCCERYRMLIYGINGHHFCRHENYGNLNGSTFLEMQEFVEMRDRIVWLQKHALTGR